MTIPRKYSSIEVMQFVDLLKNDPDMPPEKLVGMDELVRLLAHFEYMNDGDIENEVRELYRKVK